MRAGATKLKSPTFTMNHSDVMEWAKAYDGPPFHALLCDPPYHLTDIARTFQGKGGSVDLRSGRQRSEKRRQSTGFMGKRWDGGQLAFNPETWAAFGAHLHPGAFGMAFASSRGWHRLAVAIEDAGFIIHPSIFGWNQSAGFPKATRIKDCECKWDKGQMCSNCLRPEIQRFKAHRYGLQAMKPALEPIILFQKPYSGRPVDSITETGAGALNVDGGRIGTEKRVNEGMRSLGVMHDDDWQPHEVSNTVNGRWPANFYLGDEEAAARLDEQSGDLHGAGHAREAIRECEPSGRMWKLSGDGHRFGDDGGASRFFFNVREQLDEADPVHYCAKASRSERDAGLDALPVKTMHRVNAGGLENDPKWSPYECRNAHPCVKPLDLCRWLATLLLPPPEYTPRRILIPFAGVGSECVGAMQAGWDEIVAIEGDLDNQGFCEIAEARFEYWAQRAGKRTPTAEVLKPKKTSGDDYSDLPLFA